MHVNLFRKCFGVTFLRYHYALYEHDHASTFPNEIIMYLFRLSILPFPKWQILGSPKLKEFTDHNFKVHENGGKFSECIENTVGKGKIARYKQFLLFPQIFQNTCTADT